MHGVTMTKWHMLWVGSIAVFIILGFLTPGAFAADAWCNTAKCDSNWQYRKLITIDYTKVGTDNNSGYIADFPFLVTFTGSDFTEVEANTQSSGADIRFTDQQGNDLEYEIEEYDEVANKMVIWVKSNSPGIAKHQNTLVYMYYGNSGASSTANAGLVWDSNYKAVYHLHDDFLDSTSNDNDAVNSGSTDIIGQIADAQDFDGTNDSVDVTSGSANSLDVVDFTLEAWINPDTLSSFTRVITTTNQEYSMLFSNNKLNFIINGGGYNQHPATTVGTNEWTHIAVTFSDSANKIKFYINGILDVNEYAATNTPTTNIAGLIIGTTSQQWFDGTIDEVRVSDVRRSADFIKTEYNNQNSPSTFYSISSQESATGIPTFTADRTGLNTIVLTFSENVDTTTTDGSGYTLSTGTVSSNTDPTGSSNIMTLTTSGISGTSATPTVTYTQAAGTTVDGGANEVENNFNTVATDSIAPTFTADRTAVNTIVLTFSENVDTTTTDGSGYTLSTGTVSSNTDPTGSSNIMTLTTSGISGTSTISVTYIQAAGTTVDGAANEIENNFNTVATDNVTPTFTADRTDVNTIVLTFSENVSGASIANSFTVDGASSVTNTAPSNSPTVTLTTVGLTAIDSSLLVTYVAATGNIADQASNEVANGENANTPYTAPPGSWCATAKCDSNWQYRKLITIDYTKVGTDNNSGYIADFPFLVTFTGSDFTEVEANTQSSGADIRFTDQQGNDLEYEIEEYDEVANKMVIWVKSNSPGIAKHQNTLVYMYYGNSGASSTANAGLVWDSNYVGVYHMNQSTFGVSSTLDSTSNNNVGTPSTMDSNDAVSGMIGGAVDFDGTSDLISIYDAASLDIAGTITLEGWVKTTDNTNYPMMISKGAVNSAYLLFVNQDDASKPLFRLVGVGDTQATTSVADGVWHHIVGTYDGTIERVYVDGVQENTNTVSGTIFTHNNPLYLGSASTNYYMTGILDELRLSNIVRSADFIKTEYNNQNSPSTFYSISSEEGIPPPTLTITTIPPTPSSTKTSLVYTFQFNEDVTGFTSADITLNFAGAGAGAVAGSNFATTDANTYTLTLAGQDLTDLGNLSSGNTVVASVDMTGLTSVSNTSGVGAEQNTWTYNTGPSTPPSLTANQGNTQISLTWTAATGGVGSITDYIVEYKQSSNDTWLTFSDGVSTSTSAFVTGLANDVSHDFRVSAESSGMLSSASLTVTIAPAVTVAKATQSFNTSSNILFDDATVTATGSGSITVEKLNSNPEASAPSGTIVGSFYDITSSGTLSDRTVILSYSDADIIGIDESSLIIYRFSGGVWSALATIVDAGANTATATTPGFSPFVLGDSGSASSSSDNVKPSYSITFDEDEYPISIGKTKHKFKDLGFNNPITIIETGKPISVNILVYDNEGPSYIHKVELYTNLNGLFRGVDQSNAYIIYQRGNPLEIIDPNGFFSDVTFSSTEVNQKLQLRYNITFAKEMELSDIIVQTRDVSNNVAVLTVSNAWQVIQDPTTVQKTETIIIKLTDVSAPEGIEVKTLKVEKPAYSIQEEILFSGTVDDEKAHDLVSIMIRDPSNRLVTIIYATPFKEGYFETTIDTDSRFKTDGTYSALAYTDVVNKGLKTTFYFSHDVPSDITTTFGGAVQFEPLRQVTIEAGATSDWTSIPGFVADDIDDLRIWYDISGQAASWVSPQKLDFGVASAGEVFPELSWSIAVPKNTPTGVYTFEWIKQCATITGTPCVSEDLQFRIQVVPSTSPDPLSGIITFLIIIVIAIGIFVGSFFILGKKIASVTQTAQS